MAFRSKNKTPDDMWRKKNFSRLVEYGIPQEVVSQNRRFWFVVQEGEDLGGTGWDVDWITEEQASKLLELLREVPSGHQGSDLEWSLKRKLQR